MESTKVRKICADNGCKKKLSLTDYPCRCGNKFCVEHRLPEFHACTFDFRTCGIQQLSTSLIKVVAKQLETI